MNRKRAELLARMKRLLTNFVIKVFNDLQITYTADYNFMIEEIVDILGELLGERDGDK